MRGCDHDRIYSGQTNLERKFAFICKTCGECGWSEAYVLERVDFDEFCRQRVIHGWNSERPSDASARRAARLSPVPLRPERSRLPLPRVAMTHTPPRPWPGLLVGIVYFVFLGAVSLLSGLSWGEHGPILPLWFALASTGLSLFVATMLCLVWMQGSTR